MTTKEVFQSTPPARGATLGDEAAKQVEFLISIHAPREGGDCTIRWICLMYPLFQSTPPARGATHLRSQTIEADTFQSTPPARGATITFLNQQGFTLFQSTPPARGATSLIMCLVEDATISIHAPREGGDFLPGFLPVVTGISIHAPREGGDAPASIFSRETVRFQSTPPARGATYVFAPGPSLLYDFNPRPPRGGRLMFLRRGPPYFMISIHAPREGGDVRAISMKICD